MQNHFSALLIFFHFLQQDPCRYYHCVQMPSAPVESKLQLMWVGGPVEFGGKVDFECLQEGLYFELDRNQVSISLECMGNGYFMTPYTWPRCVESMYAEKNKRQIMQIFKLNSCIMS